MNLLTSRKSWLVAPVITLIGFVILLVSWALIKPITYVQWFSIDVGFAPVEWMTLPLFAMIIPLVWLCPPNSGSVKRQCLWSSLWSVLGVMAIIRETDLHKMLFAWIWPDISSTFPGTVYKMRFLKADFIPLVPKLFVLVFFIAFFAAAAIPLIRYIVPLVKGFFKFEPVAWSAAFFGIVSTFVLIIDRMPAHLRDWGIVNLKAPGHESGLALCKGLEEGAEMIMASLALLVILQSYLIFVHGRGGDSAEGGKVSA